MSPSRMFWLCVWTGNLLLAITGAIWWRVGWKWALLFLLGGPVMMLGLACVSLILFMLVDGGFARDVPCEAGCGRLAPLQLRGRRYRRPLCDQCERQRERARQRSTAGSIVDEGGVRVHGGKAEEWKL